MFFLFFFYDFQANLYHNYSLSENIAYNTIKQTPGSDFGSVIIHVLYKHKNRKTLKYLKGLKFNPIMTLLHLV